jgi:hypothetical protein
VAQFASLLQLLKHLVFLSDALVIFKMIYQAFLAPPCQEFELDLIWIGSPFEVEDGGTCALDLAPTRSGI